MKKPYVICPAAKEVNKRIVDGRYVVICALALEQIESGESSLPNYAIESSHCTGDRYEKCVMWREDKEKDWLKKASQKYSSLEQGEKLRP